jgi:predicted PurR-regulated permease PerM
MTSPTPTPPIPESPLWSRATKIIVVIIGLLLVAFLLVRFRQLVGILVVAAILAYLISPLVGYLERRLHIRRSVTILLVYLILAALVVGLLFGAGLASYQQIAGFINNIPALIEQAVALVSEFAARTEPIIIGPIVIDPITLPWDQIQTEVLGLLQPAFSQSASIVTQLASSTVRTVANVILLFVVSIYLAVDQPNFSNYMLRFTEPMGYRRDAEFLLADLRASWAAYLRGQVILGLVIFVVVWIGLTLLGVQNAVVLAMIAGLLEFIPNVGPIVSTAITMLVAFFQPSNYLGLPSWAFVLAILGFMILVQQVENHLLVPRIVGGALNLKPVLVIVGVFVGASLAGVLGAILAAPILASLKILGQYAWHKLFDQPPFPETETSPEPAVEASPPPAAA